MKKKTKSRKPSRRRIDKTLLQQAIVDGKSTKEIANEMGFTSEAIRQAIKKFPPLLEAQVIQEEQAIERIVNNSIDVLEQFKHINEAARDVLKDAKSKKGIYSQKIVLDCCRAIQDQLEFYAKIISILHDHETIQRFQEEVLEAIGEVAPDVREKIINRLKENQSARWALESPVREI